MSDLARFETHVENLVRERQRAQASLEEAQKAGAHYVDVTPVSREAATNPALIAADGLHPSGEMYAEWASSALPIALTILK